MPGSPPSTAPTTDRRVSRSLATGLGGLVLTLASGCSDPAGQVTGSPTPPVSSSQGPSPGWWEEFTETSGVDFRQTSGAVGERQFPEIMGAGVAVFDADGDDDLDLFFTNGASSERSEATDRFYRQTAPGRFEDATGASGLGGTGYGMGVAVGDFDNDGHVDLFVTNVGADRLYRNQGDGTFADHTSASGIVNDAWSSSALFFDYDRDGFLDLFVARYVVTDPTDPCFDRTGRPTYCGPKARTPLSDQLFHNQGDGTFIEVSDAAGFASIAAAGLGAIAQDFDGDGWPDLAVANDAYINHLWINQKDGSFSELAFPLGIAFNQHGQAEAGMGIVSGDFDGDQTFDLFLTHLAVETNTVYRGIGASGFKDVTGTAGIAASSMPFTGFGVVALDADCDGDLDLMVANGRVSLGPEGDAQDPWLPYAEPNQAFVNDGKGRFEEITADSPFSTPIEITRGMATGDLDQDGDLDVVIANIEGPARLYRNVCPNPGSWLRVRAVDPALKRDAIGAVLTVKAGDRSYLRIVHGQGGYQSSSSLVAHFGLGEAETIDGLDVQWPDGMRETFPGGPVDRTLKLLRGTGTPSR